VRDFGVLTIISPLVLLFHILTISGYNKSTNIRIKSKARYGRGCIVKH
jgi:hypothetical protein